MVKLIWTRDALDYREEARARGGALDEALTIALDSLRDGTAHFRAFALESRNAFLTIFWVDGQQFAIVWRRSDDDRPIIIDIGPL